jgi:succinate-acetate transporter protein
VPQIPAQIVIRPYASALPLGFFAFGLGMAVLGGTGIGWIPAEQVKDAGLLLAAFVFPLEFLAAVIAFLARDTIGAAALGLFSTSWLALGLSMMQAKPGETSKALGVFLLWFSLTVLTLALSGIAAKPLIASIMIVAVARGLCAAVYELGGGPGWEKAGGWISWAIAVAALYGGLAFAIEDSRQREVLPTFRRGRARVLDTSIETQLDGLGAEAGVREQL